MPFSQLDTAAVARALAQAADRPDDIAEAYFERREEVLRPPGEDPCGLRVVREEGFAVRLVREGRTWLASRDGFLPGALAEAVRQVARIQPRAAVQEPEFVPPAWDPPSAPELEEFARGVERAIRAQHAAFPLRLTVGRHRRSIQMVGARLVPGPEQEVFWSVQAQLPWGRHGELLAALDTAATEVAATALLRFFRARAAPTLSPGRRVVVLAPAAAAVFLHEAVAHALEADTLALGGNPESAVGARLGGEMLNVLDDPAGGPAGVSRRTDDEGQPVLRRWLLRGGVVEQPLADQRWAARSGALLPGAARRADRHSPPGPRSSRLELLPGGASDTDLCAEARGGIYFSGASRGLLDPHSGLFTLWFPHGQRLEGGSPGDWVGPCRLRGRVANLLAQVSAVGTTVEEAGAGWCAKGGQRLPVWAAAPALRLEGAQIES